MPPERFTPLPACAVVGTQVHHHEEIGSTNDEALRAGADGAVIIADRQRAGRGRHGRAWHSAKALGLWMSVAFTEPVPGLAFGTALALRDALNRFTPVTVKWPNDILAHGRKLAGILLESRDGRTALGIGINVAHGVRDLPPELRDSATSLALAADAAIDRHEVFEAVIVSLDRRVVQLRGGALDTLFEEWVDACAVIGRRATHNGTSGEIVGVDPSGALRLETPEGPRAVMYGDSITLE